MKAHPKLTKALPRMAAIAVLGVVVGAAAAFGSTGVRAPDIPELVSWDDAGSDHAPIAEDRPGLWIDPEAPPPEVDELWDATLKAQRCLEAEGFGFLGPTPHSDGSGLNYVVWSPTAGPKLEMSNPCEDPLHSGSVAFERSAPPEARAELVEEFRATMRCLGLDDDQVEPAVKGTELVRNFDAESQVMSRFMESAEANEKCSGRLR